MPTDLFKNPPTVKKTSSSSSSRDLFSGMKNEEPVKDVKEPGYFQRVGTKYLEIGQEVTDALMAPSVKKAKGEMLNPADVLRPGLRTAGAVAEATFTPIVEAPGIKNILDGISIGIGKLSETKGIQAVAKMTQPLADVLLKMSDENPEIAKDIKNVIDIATLTSGKVVEKPINQAIGNVTKGTGKVLETSGKKGIVKETDKFVRDLVRPVQTATQKEAQVARTTEKGFGPFKKSVIEPTAKELASENVVKTIPGISKNKTFQQNFNIIQDASENEAKTLAKRVAKNDFQIPHGESLLRLERASADLTNSPLMVGDAEKTAQKLIKGARGFLEKNPETGSGVLKARKEYDVWVKQQKPKAFDPKSENAFTIANREIRNAMNDILEERAPNLGIKKSLQKQHSMFNAMENITPKASQEADTAIRRALESFGAKLGFKNKAVQSVATLVGIGGLGASSTFAPIIAQVGIPAYLLYKGGKLVLKPSLRKALGQVLKEGGSKLSSADRNLILGILNNYRETK